MFDNNSRYAKMSTYAVTLPDGSMIAAVRLPLPNPAPSMGFHPRIAGERLDLLAARYLKDPTAFWRLCDTNNTPCVDALAARPMVGIPKGPGS